VAILGGLGGFIVLSKDSEPESQSTQSQGNNHSVTTNKFKDGTYSGNIAETLYGDVQIAIVISGGKISDVEFIKMPEKDDGRSRQISEMSKPLLKKTTIDMQSDQIDFVTGATSTSYGYQESLQAALDKARTESGV
jgi:uncharacterized protein with FMN-binding domain